ncbi:bacteriocin biosynthesis protein AlbD [Saccharibacillus alkalitolerans]|uniref:Bacteriocin biosynthesis protein AlbD n=1 Tax=Saccharibacillus alkalitolerans TaxID=2705290 RepID=A0ABX0F5Z0_9BACL|nr:bacteriocin biosynthesis protein AlbD [Saccharibacillus alkalitolerans]NGZ75345.1 bacteriocin biosynthesis protein AlbD [Saccharibacillus alkalitolerans]
MELVCTLPISSRVFWTAEVLFVLMDTCLRRTVFFLILPVFLVVRSELPFYESLYWLAKFATLTFYAVMLGILFGNLVLYARLARIALHGAALVVVCVAAFHWRAAYAFPLLLHAAWMLWKEYPLLLRPVPPKKHAADRARKGSFSFYRREWKRFVSSKPMLLNYGVMAAFSAFFCYNFVHSRIAGLSGALTALAALLLSVSPIALLYSIEKNNRILLLALPIRPKSLFWQKYGFYSGLLIAAFATIVAVLSGVLKERPSLWAVLQGLELVAAGAAIRLRVDERQPLMQWTTEQKLWNNSRKYRSYAFCAPLFLAALLPQPYSNLGVILLFAIIFYILSIREGGFFA